MKIKITILLLYITFFTVNCTSQITSGKVTYIRKSNLQKIYNSENMQKIKIDTFQLAFNDSCSFFIPNNIDLENQYYWAVSYNSIFHKYNRSATCLVSVNNELFNINLDVYFKNWKLTGRTREIAGYACLETIYEQKVSGKNLYAWFSPEIIPSGGPEGFGNLPGLILGIAFEDGSINYFADNIEPNYKTEIKNVLIEQGQKQESINILKQKFISLNLSETLRRSYLSSLLFYLQ